MMAPVKVRRRVWLLAAMLAAPFGMEAAMVSVAEGETVLPVKAVALFSSGVAYFQHAGTVAGGKTVQLPFNGNQINDLLKSLVLEDLEGGQPGFVEYPSRDPLDKILDEFQINLGSHPTMAEVLGQLRGARVVVELADGKLTGTLLGVEERPVMTAKNADPISDWVVNLVEAGRLQAVALRDIRHLELVNPALRDELTNALAALDQGRGKDKKPVTLRWSGEGMRKVRIGYVVEAPVWKTSYRLILPERPEGKARVQGWAIVENQTDHDWDQIRLSLISGRPISFIQDLYQPLYASRPRVKPRLFANLQPRMYESGVDQGGVEESFAGQDEPAPAGAKGKGGAMMKKAARSRPMMESEMAMSAPPAAPPPAAELVGGADWERDAVQPGNVAAVAATRELGALFQFVVEGVTLPRRRSAMIPIVADPIQAEKVSIYNQQTLADHPLSGVMLTNTTGKHLPEGPVTLFDGGSYAGDGQMEEVPSGQGRLLSFAVDLEVRVVADAGPSENRIATARLVKGVLRLTRKLRSVRVYLLDNRGAAAKTVIVEHPVRAGWQVTEPLKPMESTVAWHRFKQSIEPGKTVRFSVAEEQTQQQEVVLVKGQSAHLLHYVQNDQLSKRVREKLEVVVREQQAVEELQRQVAEGERSWQALQQEQGRIRENIRALPSGSPSHDQMTRKLMDREAAIDKRQVELDGLRAKAVEQQKKLEEFLGNLNLE